MPEPAENSEAGPQAAGGRIWYIYPPAGGPGLGRYWRAYELARAWIGRGLSPLVIAPGYFHMRQDSTVLAGFRSVAGVRHLFLPMKPYSSHTVSRVLGMARMPFDLLLNADLREEGRRTPPTTIIYSSPYPFGVPAAWWLARRFGARFIVEIRDLWPLSVTEVVGTPGWHPFVILLGLLERFAYAKADHVVSLLRYAEPHMAALGLRPGRFSYIPNGVQGRTDEGEEPSPLGARIDALKKQRRFVVIHGGNMSESTPLDGLIKAISLLQAGEGSRIHLVIVGRGDLEGKMRALAAEIAPTAVEFHPQVDRQTALDAYRRADVGFSSFHDLPLYRFGVSPNKVFDYMAEALPVLIANVKDGKHFEGAPGVITCDLTDVPGIARAILELARTPESERRAKGLQNRAWVLDNHGYDALADRYTRLFEPTGGSGRQTDRGRRRIDRQVT